MARLPVSVLYSAVKLKAHLSAPISATEHTRDGTGFFVCKGGIFYLATNRHIVDAIWDPPNRDSNREKFQGYRLGRVCCRARTATAELRKFQVFGQWNYSQAISDDVAVLSVDRVLPSDNRVVNVDNYYHFKDLAHDARFAEEILLGDQVVFPSYGEGHSEAGTRPTLRIGWIISDVSAALNYETVKGGVVLIEGFSTEGASGAPVIAPPIGIQAGPGFIIDGRPHRPMRIVGVNAGHFRSPSFQHSQISYAFKASIIRRVIESTQTLA